MTTRFALAGLLTSLLLWRSLTADESKLQSQELNGRWNVTELVVDGVSIPLSQADEFWWQIEGDAWQYSFVIDGRRVTADFTVALDDASSPLAVDATLNNGAYSGEVCKGIIQFDGDQLRLCLSDDPSLDRPDQFESAAGSGRQLFVLSNESTANPN